ncbi:hypothetical protein ATCC90586_009303 [Pythium insidiosum]|nr:hypothetical protein ATCC90586_009303 [Pythium insidiosum]
MEQLARLEQRVREMEEAYALERQQRDALEKKYARLKRRYARLERVHAHVLEHAQETLLGADSRRLHAMSPTPSITTASTRDSTPCSAVIDLTSPSAARHASRRASPAMSSEDYCAESPTSPDEARWRYVQRLQSSSPSEIAGTSPSTPLSSAPASSSRRRQLNFHSEPVARLGSRFGDDIAPHQPHRSVIAGLTGSATGSANVSGRATETAGSTAVSSHITSEVEDDTSEAASLALAHYLQQQENLAAMQEYEASIRAASHRAYGSRESLSRTEDLLQQQDADIDPDNMTYDELLQLGERVGDVKKEQWREVAVHVLSSLPTHRWSTRSESDVSCIICQESYNAGEVALTLPCAHVFHEDCVSGWIRENNSCPLCKLPIADI